MLHTSRMLLVGGSGGGEMVAPPPPPCFGSGAGLFGHHADLGEEPDLGASWGVGVTAARGGPGYMLGTWVPILHRLLGYRKKGERMSRAPANFG